MNDQGELAGKELPEIVGENGSITFSEGEIDKILASLGENSPESSDLVQSLSEEQKKDLIFIHPELFEDSRIVKLLQQQVETQQFDVETGARLLLHLISQGEINEVVGLIEKMDEETQARLKVRLDIFSDKAKRSNEGAKTRENTQANPETNPIIQDPRNDIPEVSSADELANLQGTIGESGQNEVQRSGFYRTGRQLDELRNTLKDYPSDRPLAILNVGPARLEEAVLYASAAKNAQKMDSSSITFVDIQPATAVNPNFDLGRDFTAEPIAPNQLDQANFYQTSDGTFEVNEDIQEYINQQLRNPDNRFATAIEAYLKESGDGKKYDLVTFNNVAQYLGRGAGKYDNPLYQKEGDFTQFQAVLLALANKVAEGGLLFAQVTPGVGRKNIDTMAVLRLLKLNTNFESVFEVVDAKQGIYRKINDRDVGVIAN